MNATELDAATALTDQLWAGTEDIYAAILDHPFLRRLADGSLSREAFGFHITQDALFLRGFARALSVLAARAPGEGELRMLDHHATLAVDVERSLHRVLLSELGVGEDLPERTQPAPTTTAYVSYQIAIAYGGAFAEALGAMLPCYWVYWRVGRELERRSSRDPMYRRWIDGYTSAQFATTVGEALRLVDRVGAELSAASRTRVQEAFRCAVRYQWMFWEMSWRRERWPI